jgi:uncharacterized protein (DUF1778 family)
LETRIPARQKSVILRAAAIKGQTLTDFVLSATTQAAEKAIQEHDILALTQRDQVAFAEALLAPPVPNARLRAAARRHRRVHGK